VLTTASLLALGDSQTKHSDNTWHASNFEALRWLMGIFPDISWPADGVDAVARLSTLLARWLRFNLPPFLLAAASPTMTSPTASKNSFWRLVNGSNSTAADCAELNFPKPKPRGKANIRFTESKLTQAMKLAHDYANPRLHVGEDWARMKGLSTDVSGLDCSMDLAAAAVVHWIQLEAGLWVGSQGDRIQVSSLSTYIYLLAPAFAELTPINNLKEWTDEWFDFTALLRRPPGSKVSENSPDKVEERITAAKRFVGKLRSAGYPVPEDLFDGRHVHGADGMRCSAASVLILDDDRTLIRSLMVKHFEDSPLDSRLASLYVDLRFNASLRSIEAAVLPLDAIDIFKNIAVTTDGFSHLKSEHARRLQALLDPLIGEYRKLTESIR